MRILLIAPDRGRAALVMEGLAGLQPVEVREAAAYDQAEAQVFAPDVVVVACDCPGRDTLEMLRAAGEGDPRPVIMFADRSEPGLGAAAVEAGLAAYVVDGLSPARVGPVIEAALARFAIMQRMRAELAKARADLASRRTVERAKGLLMKGRGLDEEAAYAILRKLAMDKGRPIGAVAADLLAFADLLKSDGA
jgi:response regulator NasT